MAGRFPCSMSHVMAWLLAGWRRPRRAAAVLIVALLALVAFESGVHSVHHVGDHVSPTGCGLAAMGDLVGLHLDAMPVAVAGPSLERLVVHRPPCPDVLPLTARPGRAPPLAA